jgi:uncharacterized membrane protein SpoIIM required for sporulation
MDIDNAIRSGFRVLGSHPSGVLPLYLFEASTWLIVRVPLFIGAALAFVVLLGTGRITPIIREFQELDVGASPAMNPSQYQGLIDALAGLISPVTIAIIGISLLFVLVLWVVTRSVAAAGTLHAVYAAQTDCEPLLSGVNGIACDTLRFIGLQLVRYGLFVLVSLPLLFILATVNGVGDVFLAIGYGFLAALTFIIIEVALLFAGPAIVIDDVGPLTAIRRSLGFLRSRPDAVIAYIGIVILVGLVAVVVWAIVWALSISQVFVLFFVLVISPYLDSVKTGLYAEDTAFNTAREGNVQPFHRSIVAFRNGWSQVVRFVIRHPTANAVSFGIFILGIVIGWFAVSGFSANFSPTTDVRNVFGSFPIDVFVTLAVNNWYVAANEVFAGAAFAIPAITNLLLNGILIGVIGGVSAFIPFVALVLPHGIIEIPALAIAGGVGLHLGRVVWNGVRGRKTTDEIADEIGRAYDILLGLALLFVIAAFIEAFITPWIGSMVISTAG